MPGCGARQSRSGPRAAVRTAASVARASQQPALDPPALLAALIALLWLTFLHSHGSGVWRSAAYFVSFLALTWSSRKALVQPFSALERITSPLWPAYATAYQWLWHMVRHFKAYLTVALIIALPFTLEFSLHGPPATTHAAQTWSSLLIVVWGLQLTLGLIMREWRRPSAVKLVSTAQAYSHVADGALADRVTRDLVAGSRSRRLVCCWRVNASCARSSARGQLSADVRHGHRSQRRRRPRCRPAIAWVRARRR